MKKISFKDLVSMVLSCVICSIAVNWVALPNGFVVTGLTGLSMTAASFVGINYALIFGTLTVAEATSENQAGSASFDYLYAGIAFDYESEGAAAVNGEVTINEYMVVSNEATVDQDMIDSFRNSIVRPPCPAAPLPGAESSLST